MSTQQNTVREHHQEMRTSYLVSRPILRTAIRSQVAEDRARKARKRNTPTTLEKEGRSYEQSTKGEATYTDSTMPKCPYEKVER